jgi:hypothetical protein
MTFQGIKGYRRTFHIASAESNFDVSASVIWEMKCGQMPDTRFQITHGWHVEYPIRIMISITSIFLLSVGGGVLESAESFWYRSPTGRTPFKMLSLFRINGCTTCPTSRLNRYLYSKVACFPCSHKAAFIRGWSLA